MDTININKEGQNDNGNRQYGICESKMPLKVNIHKVYSKRSHTQDQKRGYPPVWSMGEYNKRSFDVTVHMTPELRRHPIERKVLLRHEAREAKILAQQPPHSCKAKQTDYSHRKAAQHDPQWLKGRQGFKNTWERLGRQIS